MQKPWGQSLRRFIDGSIQLEEIDIKQGGFSSIHLHERKSNLFIVDSGILHVKLLDDENRLTRVTVIDQQGVYSVEPAIRHQFFAKTDVHGYELYFDLQGELEAEDIERFSTNGVKKLEVHSAGKPAQYCCLCNSVIRGSFKTVEISNAFRHVCKLCEDRIKDL